MGCEMLFEELQLFSHTLNSASLSSIEGPLLFSAKCRVDYFQTLIPYSPPLGGVFELHSWEQLKALRLMQGTEAVPAL